MKKKNSGPILLHGLQFQVCTFYLNIHALYPGYMFKYSHVCLNSIINYFSHYIDVLGLNPINQPGFPKNKKTGSGSILLHRVQF